MSSPLSSSVLRIVGISGSLRRASSNSGLLRAAAKCFESVPWVQFTIADIDFDLYSADREAAGRSEKVTAFSKLVYESDGLLLACPENAIDWASRPLPGRTVSALDSKPFAIFGAGGGVGSARAQYSLRQTMLYVGGTGVVRPEIFIRLFEPPKKFDENGNLIDAEIQKKVQQLCDTLIDHIIMNKEKDKVIAAVREKHKQHHNNGNSAL